MFLVVIPVIVPFLLGRGLTIGDVLTAQAVFGVSIVVLDVPTGYLCDRIGRKRTMAIGAALNALGFTGFALAHGFPAYCAIEALLGAGCALVSGADVALLYDLLDEVGAGRTARRRALADYQLAQASGEAVAALLGGALGAWSPDYAALAGALAAWLPLLLALSLREPHRPPTAGPSLPGLAATLAAIFAAQRNRLIFANMVAWNLATFIAVWLLQPYWQSSGIGIGWFGVLWAATLVTVGVVGKCVPPMERRLGPRGVLLLLAAAPGLAYAGMAWTRGTLGVAAGFLFYVSRGINAVHLREEFNHALPARFRATCNSLASGTFRLAFAAFGPVVGLAVDRAGLPAALAGLAVACLLGFLGIAVPLLRVTAPPGGRIPL